MRNDDLGLSRNQPLHHIENQNRWIAENRCRTRWGALPWQWRFCLLSNWSLFLLRALEQVHWHPPYDRSSSAASTSFEVLVLKTAGLRTKIHEWRVAETVSWPQHLCLSKVDPGLFHTRIVSSKKGLSANSKVIWKPHSSSPVSSSDLTSTKYSSTPSSFSVIYKYFQSEKVESELP